MARGAHYHAIDVDTPDEGSAPDAAFSGAPGSDELAFLPDKPLTTPAVSQPGMPPAQGPAPTPPPSDAPLGADLDLPDKPSKLAELYNQTAQADPDRAAQILQIQKRMNLPAEYVDKNLPEAQAAAASPSIADWHDIETHFPGTTKFLSQPQNMAVAKDDVRNLALHEALINHAVQADSYWDAFKAGLQGSVMGLQIRNKLPDLTLPEHADMLHSLAGMAGGILGDSPAMVVGGVLGTAAGGPLGSIAGAFALPAAIKTYQKQQITQGDAQDLPDLISRTGQILKEASKQGIVGLATGAAGALAKPLAEIGGVYLPTVAAKALGTSAPLAAESAAMELAGKGVEGEMPSARGVAENLLMVGAMHGAITPAIGHASRYLGLAVDAAKAQEGKKSFLTLGDAADTSKLLKRDPETYQAHVADLAKENPSRWIEPEAFTEYFQGKGMDPDAVAAEMGITDQVNEAKQTGNPIEIPLSTLVTKLGTTEHYAGLADDIKTAPDAPSIRQVRDAQAQAKTDVEQIMQCHADDAAKADQQAQVAGESPIYRGMYNKLVAAGLDHEQANANATLHDQVVQTLAKRTGQAPEELAAQFPVTVQEAEAPAADAPAEGAAQSYNQAKELVPTFYSRLTRTVEEKMGGSATPEQISGMLRDIKPEERKYSGLDEFLAGKTKIDKQELLDFLAEKQIQVHEVTKGNGLTPEEQARYDDLKAKGGSDSEAEAEEFQRLSDKMHGGGTTKFQNYTLPGGENYREVLFTLPPLVDEAAGAKARANQARMEELRAGYLSDTLSKKERKEFLDLKRETEQIENEQRNPTGSYRSSHWDEPNVLAHTRLSDRVDAEGKRVLHVEEVQSDWHQAGRKEGYKGDVTPAAAKEFFGIKDDVWKGLSPDEVQAYVDDMQEQVSKRDSRVPDAPFKKTWHEYVMKRLLRMAAEGGYDKLAWTKGAEQAERYDLSKQVDRIEYQPSKSTPGSFRVGVYDKEGRSPEGEQVLSKQEIAAFVGKELAEKIANDEGVDHKGGLKVLDGLDLKVGGEGMKGFYDKILPEYLNKYTKKWGGKVGETEIGTGTEPSKDRYQGPELTADELREKAKSVDRATAQNQLNRLARVMDENPGTSFQELASEHLSPSAAEAIGGEIRETTRPVSASLHSVDVTPAMKDALLFEGQSLFQGGDAARGRIRIGDQGSIIDLFKGQANESTPLHEFGHYYLNIIDKLASGPDAAEGLVADMKTIRDWMGLKDGEAIGEAQHEQWARGFEAYLREGKAPSAALEGAFRRFKTWLVSLYRKASELNVEMTPAIRDVMSRMMASEDAVEGARAEAGFRVDDVPGATPETKAKIRSLQEQAKDIAEKQLLKEQMPELKAARKEFLAKERERLTTEAEVEVKREPLYAAMEGLNEGSGKKDAAARAGRFLKADTQGKPVDPAFEELAEIHGFESGKDLAWKIVDAAKDKTFDSQVKALVDQAMQAHAPLMDKAALRTEALKAIHNDKQTEYLALEREALMGLVTKKLINQEVTRRKRIDASVSASAAKEQARAILEDKPIKDAANPRTYVTAERNAAVKAAKAIGSGDMEKAAEYKRQQMLNSALAREAMKNAESVEKSEALLNKYARRGADLMDMPYGFIRQIDQMLSKAGMAPARGEDASALLKIAQDMAAKGEAPDSIANATGYQQDAQGGWVQEKLPDIVKRINDNYYSLTLPDSVLNAGTRDAETLTMKDLKDLHDAVKSLSEIGKRFDRFLGDFQTADMKQAAKAVGDSIGKLIGAPYAPEMGIGRPSLSLQEKAEGLVRKMMDGLIPSSVSMQTLAKFLDKADDGPVHQYLYRPLKHAEDAKFGRWQTMKGELEKLISDHFTPKEFAGMKDKSTEMAFTEVPGRKLNLEERLSILLNWGNEGNRDRIRRGFDMNDEQVNRVIGSLDEKHVQFAQAVWDHLDTYWPEIKELEMRVNGVEPKQVEAAPVDTQYGPLRGGYYPIAYDFDKSQDAYKLAEQKTELFKQFSAAKAQTDRGHAEARVSSFKRPVRLSMDVFFNHLENVVHDLEFRPAVIDTARMLNQPEVKTALEGAIGIKGAKTFSDWLKSCASDQGENLTYVQKVLQWTRFRTALTSLGLRPLAIIRHLPGNIWNGMQEIGSYQMLSAMKTGLTDWVSGNGELHDYVFSRSDRMANRLTAKDRDLSDMARKWSNGQKSPVIQYAFFFQHLCDEAVSLPLWASVYDQHLSEHGENKAVDLADEAVNRALGSGSMVDRIGAQRGGQFSKLLTMNYSWMSVMMNRAWLSGKMAGLDYNDGNTGQMIATMAKAGVTLFAVPALLEVLAQESIRNAPAGSDQEKKRRMLSHALDMPFQYVLGVRDIAPPLIHAALGEHGTDYKMSPVEQALQNLLTPVGEGLHTAFTPGKHFNEKFAEDSFHAAAQLTGTPQQLNTWAFNLLDDIHNNGQATWRDLMTRKAKK